MVELSKKQFSLLVDIDNDLYLDTFNKEDVDNIKYLQSLKFVEPLHRPFTPEERRAHSSIGLVVVGNGPVCGYKTTPLGKAMIEAKVSEMHDQELTLSKASKDHKLALIGAISGLFGGATGLIALLLQLFQNTPPPAP